MITTKHTSGSKQTINKKGKKRPIWEQPPSPPSPPLVVNDSAMNVDEYCYKYTEQRTSSNVNYVIAVEKNDTDDSPLSPLSYITPLFI